MNCEAIYCFDRRTVRFAIYPDDFDGPRILAEVSVDALRDLFGAHDEGDNLVAACQAYFDRIEALAVAHHRSAPGLPVMLQTCDFEAAAIAASQHVSRTVSGRSGSAAVA